MAKPRIMVPTTTLFISRLLLLLLLLVESATTKAFASPADVTIFNRVGGPIQVHCKSGDDDMGEKTVMNGQQYGWGFTPNFWGTTLFHCSFRWGANRQAFNVWTDLGWAAQKSRPCKHCEWRVAPDGFFRNDVGKPPIFAYPWL